MATVASRIVVPLFNVSAIPLIAFGLTLTYSVVLLATVLSTIGTFSLLAIGALMFASALGTFNATYLGGLFYSMHEDWFKRHWLHLLLLFTFIKNIYDLFNGWFGAFFTAAFRR